MARAYMKVRACAEAEDHHKIVGSTDRDVYMVAKADRPFDATIDERGD
ncbi:MAG: hypothetical protein P0120_17325 [Nitrospira sp.]|nr:hypothetical protein [Nitrospira sp.]